MRKQLFMLAFAMAAMTVSAQTVIFDGANYEENADGGFLYNRADAKIVTEDGRKCLQMVTKNSGGWAHEHYNVLRNISGVNFNGLRRVSFKMKMSKGHNVLLKLSSASGTARRWFYYNGDDANKNTWQTMVFEFGIGTDAEHILDSNTEMEIWPFEDGDDAFNYNGETVFIDDIHVDGPVLKDGAAIRTLGNNSLTSKQVEITGSLSKGTYQCTWDGPWHSEAYDDYTTLTSKISADVCFLNLTGAAVADGDSPQLRTKNPNLLILSPSDFYDTDNVIRWDELNSRNNTPTMVLTDGYPFYTPIDFHANTVHVYRSLQAGINTMCLPFYVGQAEISTNCKIATFKNGTTFTFVDHADANVPFLATDVDAAVDAGTGLTFTDKGVCATGSLGTTFVGVYAPQSAKDLYGINNDGKLQKGSSTATIKSFRAYLTDVSGAREITFEDETTGLTDVSSKMSDGRGECFNLAGQRVAQPTKGLYIVNGKKVIVK